MVHKLCRVSRQLCVLLLYFIILLCRRQLFTEMWKAYIARDVVHNYVASADNNFSLKWRSIHVWQKKMFLKLLGLGCFEDFCQVHVTSVILQTWNRRYTSSEIIVARPELERWNPCSSSLSTALPLPSLTAPWILHRQLLSLFSHFKIIMSLSQLIHDNLLS